MEINYLHVFRLLVSLIILPLLAHHGVSVFTLIIVLLFLDLLDCDIFVVNLLQINNYCGSIQYQRLDKLVDLIVYSYALYIFSYLFDTRTIVLLILFIIWRGIGVYKYQSSNYNGIIHKYADFINSTMLVYYLSTKNRVVYDYYYLFIILGIWFKFGYEKWHHNKLYYSLYRPQKMKG